MPELETTDETASHGVSDDAIGFELPFGSLSKVISMPGKMTPKSEHPYDPAVPPKNYGVDINTLI